jgi:hypothetical protein
LCVRDPESTDRVSTSVFVWTPVPPTRLYLSEYEG